MKIMNINALILEQKLQSRTEISEETVTEYAEAIAEGDKFPPVLVYFDGIHYYLTDGYHRYHAHKRAGRASIECEVVSGTLRDAIFASTAVNAAHGMRRTNADKRKAIMTLLDDFEWEGMSNSELANHCGVSATFVAGVRASLGKQNTDTVKYKTPSGKVMEKKKAPGRQPKQEAPEPVAEQPEPEQEDHANEAVAMLLSENEELKVRVALGAMEATSEERSAAATMIEEMREELRITKIELDAVKRSRDQYQSENSELKKQVSSMQRQMKKEKTS